MRRVPRVGRLILAGTLLSIAQFLVWAVPFRFWRSTLGSIATETGSTHDAARRADDVLALLGIGRVTERASALLPLPTKCLARAICVQWTARMLSLPSTFVIAVKCDRDASGDRFHAWVETDDWFAVGACERTEYLPMLRFVTQPS